MGTAARMQRSKADNITNTRNQSTDSGFEGAASRIDNEFANEPSNFGSARSDYGDLAYGGTLDEQGLGGKSVDDFEMARRDAGSRGYMMGATEAHSGSALTSAMMLLAGAGIGALLMYVLDPNQGRGRRAYLRDKMVSASNNAADYVQAKSRHLTNRAQGMVSEVGSRAKDVAAGAGSALGIQGGGQEQTRRQV